MRVLQLAKRFVTIAAAVCIALTGCSDSGPEVPFNPAGTSQDIAAVNSTLGSPTFASFSWFSPQFDAALGGSALISASAGAFDFRRVSNSGELRATALRSARRLASLTLASGNRSFSASAASVPSSNSIPLGLAGKTFEQSGGSYVPTDRAGAPANGVRFILYDMDPGTSVPVQPLVETGYVELTDLSEGSTQAARVIVVSGTATYLDYLVTVTPSAGQVMVTGFVTDGTNQANINLRSTVTSAAGLTLRYRVDVPERDVTIDLKMTATGLDQENPTINIGLAMSGPNGTVSMSGQFTSTGATLTVRTGGTAFATITVTGDADPVITGADGQPITPEDAAALQGIFELTGEAFIFFDQMLTPVTFFLEPAA